MSDPGERLPRRQQRRIQRHRTPVGFDGRNGPARRAVAVPALLKQAAEAGVELLEALERSERIRDAAEVALAHGDEIQDIPVLGNLLEQAAGVGERAGELALLDERADAPHLALDAGAGADGLGGRHQRIIARAYFSENLYVMRKPMVRGGTIVSDFTNSR